MFKRANKITALLVAAASVISIVPAMAADSTRLGTKDGTIENAVAFKGNYIYEGYKGDSSKAVYFNNGDKDKELTDYEDYSFTTGEYSDKYILAEDNGDEYLTDLSNGSITEDTVSDKLDSTASKLEKGLTKTDKYDGATIASGDLNPVIQTTASAKFQEPWYYVNNAATLNNTIFTDANGKYVDTSVLANVYAYSSAKQKMVKVEKFNKAYTDTQLEVNIVKQPEVIAQDKDNLYAIVNVDITDNHQTSTAVATKASATVDYSKAVMGNTSQISAPGSAESVAIDTSAFVAGTDVTVNGVKYTFNAATCTAADLLSTLTNTSVTGYTKSVVGSVVTFTATTNGNKTDMATSATALLATTTQGVADTYTDQPAIFTVAGANFTYDAASGVGKYKDATDLKNKVIATFAGTTGVTYGANAYDFDATTSTFTASTAGTLATADVISDLGTVTSAVAGTAAGVAPTGTVTNAWYLQKISKAQGDTDEEAYEPKSVTSYQIDNNSLYDNSDVNDAYDWLIDGSNVASIYNVEVKDNSLYAYKTDGDNVKVTKLDLKQIKEDAADTATYGTTKLDGYVVAKDGDTDQDFDAIDVDTNGIVWALHDGKIIKFAGKDKTTVYTCDAGFDSFNVYDDSNLIAWNQDDEYYTTVNEGTKVTQDESTAVAPVVVTGWVQLADGTWNFNDVTGAKVSSKWINVGGVWYYMKADGVMATGWLNDNGTWYYLAGSGAMKTGWLNDNGTWYYLNASGAMLANTTVDGYVLGASGAWIK